MATAHLQPKTAMDRYRASLKNIKPLDPQTELELAEKWRAGDERAGVVLVESSLPFVIRVAREYQRWGVPLEDLVQQGNLGLLRAAAKFDPEKKCRLVTYAAYWIRAEIRDYVVRSYRIVRLGATRTERRAIRAFRREGVEDAEELANLSGMPLARAKKLWPLLGSGDVSLDASYAGRPTPMERLEDDFAPDPEVELERERTIASVRDRLDDALATLSDRERLIVQSRMIDEDPRTLEDIGNELGVSKERVRQLEARAKRKLQAVFADLAPQAA